MITEDYVSYEVAKLLKEKGFNEPCFYYYKDKVLMFSPFLKGRNSYQTDTYSAPTHQMAMKWLREVHRLFICVEIGVGAYVWNITNTTDHVVVYVDATVGTYEEACEAALKYCLENLI